MSRIRRSFVLVVAWAVPIAWTAAALLSGPSDGTTIASALGGVGDDRWSDTPEVVRTFGDNPLRRGDVVLTVDGRTPGDWVRSGDPPDRRVGEVVAYEVRRARDGGLSLDLTIAVPLSRYPVAAALKAEPAPVAVSIALLLCGSLAWWRRPTAPSAIALLAAASLAPAALTAHPFGLGVIDLAGSRGWWPHLVGEALAATAVGLLLAVALLLTGHTAGRTHVAAINRSLAALVVPALGWGLWLLVSRDRLAAGGPESWHVWATVLGPAALLTAPAVLAALVLSYARSEQRPDLQSARLALVGVGGGVTAWLVLGALPWWASGAPVVPWSLLVALLPVSAACVAVAVAHYRLDDIEPAVRRAAAQLAVAALIVTAFVLAVGAVEVTSDVSPGSMLAGGLVSLLLLPVAVALQRGARRLVHGDRELPYRVVSELRRLDPTTPPEEALHEVLTLLARRLRLGHASVVVFATPTTDAVVASTGAPSGAPVDVDLAVGGTVVGRLRLEVEAGRDPFRPGDRRLLEDVGSQVGALVQAVVVNRELQRSREHLVATREEERRRLRRDLHDGLGPSLASLAMRLEVAQELIGADPGGAAEMVGQLSDQVRDEIAEVRRLVDGLRPPALDQLGLVSALQQRADELNAAGALPDGTDDTGARQTRRGMSVVLDVGDGVDQLPAAVEVAAYRIALEAVTNAQRHSGAETCRVVLRREGDVLRLQVTDSGVGLAESRPAGVGLSSMRERAQELGGACTVTSVPGSGTTVEVELPVPSRRPEEE